MDPSVRYLSTLARSAMRFGRFFGQTQGGHPIAKGAVGKRASVWMDSFLSGHPSHRHGIELRVNRLFIHYSTERWRALARKAGKALLCAIPAAFRVIYGNQ
jgi:hypothetical protein